jgi:hypothetical protein
VAYYDKQGKCLSMIEWAELFDDLEYQRVKQDHLPNGVFLSTVWSGIDHNFMQFVGEYKPVIFETMLFLGGSETELVGRWTSEATAI